MKINIGRISDYVKVFLGKSYGDGSIDTLIDFGSREYMPCTESFYFKKKRPPCEHGIKWRQGDIVLCDGPGPIIDDDDIVRKGNKKIVDYHESGNVRHDLENK